MEGQDNRIEIFKGLSGEVIFDVDTEGETLWASIDQIAQVFGVSRRSIEIHLKNIYAEGELSENSIPNDKEHKRTAKKTFVVRKEGNRTVRREIRVYNLDAIISVGYRVNSKKATQFRVWATNTLRKYLINGVVVNERRLKAIRERKELKKLHDVENMMFLVRRLTAQNELDAGEANGILEVISKYTGSFQTLEEYDDGFIDLSFMSPKKHIKELTINICRSAVNNLKKNVKGSDLFGKERGELFSGSIAAIFQSFDDKELYQSIPEKAANLLYFIIKDHPFYDGNKRIGALLFILFLTLNDYHLTKNGETKISDRALTAITLLIAESKPSEKELIVSLVCKLLE